MLEEVIYYEERGTKYGIIAHPAIEKKEAPLVVFLNAGLVNRQGPNGIYVKLSRDLKAAGFASFRFDLPGIGDNINDSRWSSKTQFYAEELRSVIDHFRAAGRFDSFILLGLCTGANMAFDYALGENAVKGICMINGTRMPQGGNGGRSIRVRYYRKYLTDIRRWLKFLSFKKLLRVPGYFILVLVVIGGKAWSLLSGKAKGKAAKKDPAAGPKEITWWPVLLNRGVEVFQVVSEGSESFDCIDNPDKRVADLVVSRDNYREQIIYDADHTFTSIVSQKALIEGIVRWCQSRFN